MQLERVELDLEAPAFTRALARIHVWPLDSTVCRMSTRFNSRSDPADELIAATSVVHKVPLVTRDRRIRRSKKTPIART